MEDKSKKTKFKFTWGHGIAIFLVVFVITTLSVVTLIITDDTYNHELVSKHYYEDELKFQDEIDKAENAKKLSVLVKYRTSHEGLTITFPNDFPYEKITGVIKMMRPSKEILDFEVPVKLDENYQIFIPADKAIEGMWSMVIDWEVGDQQFMYKAKLRR